MPADKCRCCNGAADPPIVQFRDFLVEAELGVLVKHREVWTSRSGSLVVMFDENGNWFVKGKDAADWEAIGHGLRSLKEHLRA